MQKVSAEVLGLRRLGVAAGGLDCGLGVREQVGEAVDERLFAVGARQRGRDGEQTFIYGFADFLSDAEVAIEAAGGDPEAAKAENFG